jgi:hypothetical protein
MGMVTLAVFELGQHLHPRFDMPVLNKITSTERALVTVLATVSCERLAW